MTCCVTGETVLVRILLVPSVKYYSSCTHLCTIIEKPECSPNVFIFQIQVIALILSFVDVPETTHIIPTPAVSTIMLSSVSGLSSSSGLTPTCSCSVKWSSAPITITTLAAAKVAATVARDPSTAPTTPILWRWGQSNSKVRGLSESHKFKAIIHLEVIILSLFTLNRVVPNPSSPWSTKGKFWRI